MAYVTPGTVAAGDVATAAAWNVMANDVIFLVTPPGCRLLASASMAIASLANTVLTFDVEQYDTDSMHSTTSNTSRVTVNTAGIYQFSGAIRFPNNASGSFRHITLLKNGTVAISSNSTSALAQQPLAISATDNANIGDYYELSVFYDGGAGPDSNTAYTVSGGFITGGGMGRSFSAQFIGRAS